MSKRISTLLIVAVLGLGAGPLMAANPASGPAAATAAAPAAACEKQADDRKLHGAARNSFVKKCSGGAAGGDAGAACEQKATDKKLHGAARTSFVKKCTADAK